MPHLPQSLKNILKVSTGTLGSRVLGLARDMLTMAYLGVNAVSAAFIFAFMVPNLFRRLMGEGAMSSAFIPVFSQTLKSGGKEKAFEFLNRILTRSAAALLAIVIVAAGAAVAAHALLGGVEKYALCSAYAAVMMPYMLMICLAAVICASLNVMGYFALPAMTAVWLNIAIISSILLAGAAMGAPPEGVAAAMCAGVLAGGAAQLAIPAMELRSKGWRFKPDFSGSPEVSEFFSIFAPALVGAGIIQANMFASNALALWVNDVAVSAIYVSSRLVELPLGMFTFAIVTVYFPKLAMISEAEKSGEYSREYARALVSLMFITVPAAAGLAALSPDILQTLFEWGRFGTADVEKCAPVLAISAAGIPFYSLATFSARGFHSLKDTRTPMMVSAAAFAVNLALALALMGPFEARGLVAANVASGIFQAAALNFAFSRRRSAGNAARETAKIAAAAAVMAAAVLAGRHGIRLFLDGRAAALASCAALIPGGVAVYAAALWAMRFGGFRELKNILKRRGLQ